MRLIQPNINYTIESSRLIIKPIEPKSISQEYINWLKDSEVNQYLETKEGSIKSITEYINSLRSNKLDLLAVFNKKQTKHIGNISITNLDKNHGVFGLMIGDKKSRLIGLGGEATICIMKLFYENLDVNNIVLGMKIKNEEAKNNLISLGFKKKNELTNSVFYEMNKEMWIQKIEKLSLIYNRIKIKKQ